MAPSTFVLSAQRDKLLDTYKQIGTVIEAFRLNHKAKFDAIMREYVGRAAIGHVREIVLPLPHRVDPVLI